MYPTDRSLLLPIEELAQLRALPALDGGRFSVLIDSYQSYDLLWARALRCSCRGNTQTEQADPTCTRCDGIGWRYVHPMPEEYPQDCAADGSVTYFQGVPIRGLLTAMTMDPDIFAQLGTWIEGAARLTVKPEVGLGYFDRLNMVDALMPFDQVLTRSGGTVTVGRRTTATQLRYPVIQVLSLHTLTTRYRLRTDYTVDAAGQIVWVVGRGPTEGDLFSVRYTFHPHWIVTGFPNSVRGYRMSPKQTGVAGKTVFSPLPISATVKLDFLVRMTT